MRRALLGLCVGAVGYSILAMLHFPAKAQNIEVASGVICDTAEQIKMFGILIDEAGSQKAMDRVNEDAKDPMACVPGTVAYFVVDRGEIVRAYGKEWQVSKIAVVGILSNGMVQHIEPKEFFVLLPATDRGA